MKGELAIGLFAVRDIGVDEELTFDYNFERYGDQVRLCLALRVGQEYICNTQYGGFDSNVACGSRGLALCVASLSWTMKTGNPATTSVVTECALRGAGLCDSKP